MFVRVFATRFVANKSRVYSLPSAGHDHAYLHVPANARLMYQEDELEVALCHDPDSNDCYARVIRCDLTKVFMEGIRRQLGVEALRYLLCKISWEINFLLKDEERMKNARKTEEAKQKEEAKQREEARQKEEAKQEEDARQKEEATQTEEPNLADTTSAYQANEDSDYLFLGMSWDV